MLGVYTYYTCYLQQSLRLRGWVDQKSWPGWSQTGPSDGRLPTQAPRESTGIISVLGAASHLANGFYRQKPPVTSVTSNYYILLCLEIRKDTKHCPQDFCPEGGILVKDLDMVIFWTLYFVPFALIVDSTLCKHVFVFLGGNSREKGENSRAVSTWMRGENMKWSVFSWWSGQSFLEMAILILEWTHLKNMGRNQTKICPEQELVTKEYPSISVLSYYYISVFLYGGFLK